MISARHLASPLVISANTVRISCVERFNQVLAHQVTPIIGAAKTLERAVFQNNWLKLRKNRLAQLALRRAVHPSAYHHGGGSGESGDGQSGRIAGRLMAEFMARSGGRKGEV